MLPTIYLACKFVEISKKRYITIVVHFRDEVSLGAVAENARLPVNFERLQTAVHSQGRIGIIQIALAQQMMSQKTHVFVLRFVSEKLIRRSDATLLVPTLLRGGRVVQLLRHLLHLLVERKALLMIGIQL